MSWQALSLNRPKSEPLISEMFRWKDQDMYRKVARWPIKYFEARRAEKIFFCLSRVVWGHAPQKSFKIECPRLAKNAFLAIERNQISSKISVVC